MKKLALKLSSKQTTLLAAALITGLAGAASIKAGKLGLVDVQQVISSSKGGADFTAINKRADSALAVQAKTIQVLQNKISSGKASTADLQTLKKAQTTYQTATKTYDAQRQKAFAPIAGTINAAVAAAARAQGYTVVLDKRKAAASGIIIYANSQTTDLTAAVQKTLKK